MADKKISELPSITGADLAGTDVFPVVDVSTSTTSKITRAEFFKNTPSIDVTGDVTIADKIVHSGDTNTAIRFPTADTVTVETSGAERMRVTSTGNVGIGTTTPADRLDVVNSMRVTSATTASVIALSGNATDYSALRLRQTATESRLESFAAGTGTFAPLTFTVNSSERMRIDSSGNVGIGTSSPNAASIIDAQSTTKGVRFPNMTTTQKNAIANVAGNVIFDTTLGKLCVNTGSGWQTITSV